MRRVVSSVSIPAALKERMRAFSHVNWSAVACMAFYAKVRLLEYEASQNEQIFANAGVGGRGAVGSVRDAEPVDSRASSHEPLQSAGHRS